MSTPEGMTLLSWARSTGSISVTDTLAHLIRDDDETRTLCGVKVPRVARPSTPPGSIGPFARTWANGPEETATLDRCKRCERKATA